MSNSARDHGGGIDAMRARYGGTRAQWLDLSTGINPRPYPLPGLPADAWTALPDNAAQAAFEKVARRVWDVPEQAGFLAAPGASSLIARIPALLPAARVQIRARTYNEHAAAFTGAGWRVVADGPAEARVIVHPNNPTGDVWDGQDEAWKTRPLVVIDESFCDETPQASLIRHSGPGVIVLKSIGKFWGLAGLRLGAAIGDPAMIAQLAGLLGPWPVSGPALAIGTAALSDTDWAATTRAQVAAAATRLDKLMTRHGARRVGGTSLFRLYDVTNAAHWKDALARHHVLTRTFPYAANWLRLGLPLPDRWAQLKAALQSADLA